MSDTRHLLQRVAGIRNRLEQPPVISNHADVILRDDPPQSEFDELPSHCHALNGQAHRLISHCRHTLAQLRDLDQWLPRTDDDSSDSIGINYRQCAAIVELCIRTIQHVPTDLDLQMRLCEGLNGVLDALDDRIVVLRSAVIRTEQANEQLASLAQLLTGLISGSTLTLEPFTALADAVVFDALQGAPLRVFQIDPISAATGDGIANEWLARHVAGHSLNVAQVAARIAKHTSVFHDQPRPVILASLLHDVGMLNVPFEIVAQPGALACDQRRELDQHANCGASIIEEQLTGPGALAESIRQHHTPFHSSQSPLARVLAVCDAYAAMLAVRPHRDAIEPPAALTEVQLHGQHGHFDPEAVRALRNLTIYPVGTAVELVDGDIGIVVAVHNDLPQSPIVEVLCDAMDQPVANTPICDLSLAPRSIRRCLPADERQLRLGLRFPQHA